MRIVVKARPGAREDRVERLDQPSLNLLSEQGEMPVYKVSVKEVPEKGRANDALVRVLAEHFGVSRQAVRLVAGAGFRQKVFEVKVVV